MIPLNDIYHPIAPKNGTSGFRIRLLKDTNSTEKLTAHDMLPVIETSRIKGVYPHDVVKTIRYLDDDFILCSLNDQDLFEISSNIFDSLFEPANPLERYKFMTSERPKRIKKV